MSQSDIPPKSFQQHRKESTLGLKDRIRGLLQEFYSVDKRQVVNVEQPDSGRYDTAELDTLTTLDFNGIDWLVDTAETCFGVGERIRTGDRDFSLRVHNGHRKSEHTRIPKARLLGGIYPRHYLVARRKGQELQSAYLVDMDELTDAIADGRLDGRRVSFDDGTTTDFYDFRDLAFYDCIVEVFDL